MAIPYVEQKLCTNGLRFRHSLAVGELVRLFTRNRDTMAVDCPLTRRFIIFNDSPTGRQKARRLLPGPWQ